MSFSGLPISCYIRTLNEERMIGDGWTKEQLLEAVPTARTVPQIILKGKLIGGYDQLKAHFNKEQEEKDARD